MPVIAGRYKRIALIANAQTELANITAGSTYDALKQVEVVGRFGQEGTGTYIPMYGEHAPAGGFELKAGVSQTIAQEIPLIRMLAEGGYHQSYNFGSHDSCGKGLLRQFRRQRTRLGRSCYIQYHRFTVGIHDSHTACHIAASSQWRAPA